MSWLPKREKLDPVQAAVIDFIVVQAGNFYIKGEAGTGKLVVLAHIAAKLATSELFGTKRPAITKHLRIRASSTIRTSGWSNLATSATSSISSSGSLRSRWKRRRSSRNSRALNSRNEIVCSQGESNDVYYSADENRHDSSVVSCNGVRMGGAVGNIVSTARRFWCLGDEQYEIGLRDKF